MNRRQSAAFSEDVRTRISSFMHHPFWRLKDWILLGVEVTVMAVLYQRGEGRIALLASDTQIFFLGPPSPDEYQADVEPVAGWGDVYPLQVRDNGELDAEFEATGTECLVGKGPPYLAYALAYRAAISVLAQMVILGKYLLTKEHSPGQIVWPPDSSVRAPSGVLTWLVRPEEATFTLPVALYAALEACGGKCCGKCCGAWACCLAGFIPVVGPIFGMVYL